MLIYSHRGESKYAPENTLSSFYLAYLLNSDGIECDVRKTKDDKLVIIHDKTVNRTSNNKGKVSDYNLQELKEINFGNKIYTHETIMTLDEFLKIFSNKNINIYIEIKETGYEKLIWDTISKYNLKNVTLISFKYEILLNLRKISNVLKLGWLVYDINHKIVDEALKINISILICNSIAIDKKDIKLAKDKNLQIVGWGIKNISELRRLYKLDLDGLIYDSSFDAKKELKND